MLLHVTRLLRCLVAGAWLLLSTLAQATPFLVTIDTTSVAGTDAVMFLDLDHTGVTYAHVQVSGFNTDGTLDPMSAAVDPAGADVTGTLPADVSISNFGFEGATPIAYFQNIALGNSISFTFDMDAGSADPQNPDGFDLQLLDAITGAPLLSDSGIQFLFSLGQGCDASTDAVKCESAPVGAPEPASLPLIFAAFLALSLLRMHRLRN